MGCSVKSANRALGEAHQIYLLLCAIRSCWYLPYREFKIKNQRKCFHFCT